MPNTEGDGEDPDTSHAAIVESSPHGTIARSPQAFGTSFRDPVGAYLASLNTLKSRTTAIESMRRIARIVLDDAEDDSRAWQRIPWASFDPAMTTMVREESIKRFRPATARLTVTIMKGVLHQCYRLKMIDAEQYESAIDLEAVPGKSLPAGRFLTSAEIALIRGHCARLRPFHGAMLWALFAVALSGGLRREELARLTVAGATATPGRLRFMGKGLKEADQAIRPWAASALARWLKMRARFRFTTPACFVKLVPNGAEDKPMTVRQVWATVVETVTKAGVKRATPHDLRRTIGTLSHVRGGARLAQHVLRHESATTSALYDRRGNEELEAQLDATDEWGGEP